MSKPRTPKGECSIVVRSGRLRLRIPASVYPEGKQQEIALNMADTLAGRTVAAQIFANVQLDIYNGELDPTLDKYNARKSPNSIQSMIYGVSTSHIIYLLFP